MLGGRHAPCSCATHNLTRIHFRDHRLGVRPIPRRGNRSPSAAASNFCHCRPFGPNDYVFIHAANTDM